MTIDGANDLFCLLINPYDAEETPAEQVLFWFQAPPTLDRHSIRRLAMRCE